MKLVDYIKSPDFGTASDLAKRAGISYALLSQIKTGKIRASAKTAVALYHASKGHISMEDIVHPQVVELCKLLRSQGSIN